MAKARRFSLRPHTRGPLTRSQLSHPLELATQDDFDIHNPVETKKLYKEFRVYRRNNKYASFDIVTKKWHEFSL